MASKSTTQAQNLVYNGSFEEYSECPQSNELNNGQFERAVGWFRPTLSTPDYFNSCNPFGGVGIPNNFWGHQEAFHGNGYVGIVPIEWNMDGEYVGSEYFRTELLSPLKPCVEYRFRMYVSLANKSTHGVGKLGALFTEDNQFIETWLSFLETPQVIHDGNPIGDTVNWTKIEGNFVAKGFEKYLTIGYFQNNVYLDTIHIQNSIAGSSAPYYYIDSISLYELDAVAPEFCNFNQIELPNVITANNDGINDFIDVSKYIGIIEHIHIVNRWGNIVTVLSQNNPVWDGGDCIEGVYFYSFSYKIGNKIKKQSGFIQLVR